MPPPSLEDLPTISSPREGQPPGGAGRAGSARRTRFVLQVTAGPDRGREFTVGEGATGRTFLGQSPLCEIRLSDREVSRRHAALEVAGGELRLTDLESRNGTWVGRLRITDAFLRGGETVQVGSTQLRVESAVGTAEAPLPLVQSFGRMAGGSDAMRRLYPLCARLAATDIPVLIEGETGTGKEVLAESIHEASPRAAAPFVVFDCTAVPPNLVESELFGHERGAFTGAITTRKGVFEQAHGGTLLIDEIGDLELSLQPKLLRALERFEVRRVGGDRWIKIDIRVISATRRDLDREVQAGRFRDDLFHRLAVARIELPPLRKRSGDVPLLARRFAEQAGSSPGAIGESVLARWSEYGWPGNVRELRNAVARTVALGDWEPANVGEGTDGARGGSRERSAANDDVVRASNDVFDRVLGEGLPLVEARRRIVEQFEERYIERVLAAHGGNVVRAAAASGIARRYFQILRARVREAGGGTP